MENQLKCLICEKLKKSKRSLGVHVVKTHKIKMIEYKRQFNLIPKCQKCSKELTLKNITGFCTHCRDRTGENNPFYGCTHDRDMIERTKIKLSKISKEKWQDSEYRDKVKKGTTGLKRSDDFKKKQSENTKKQMRDPKQRELRSIYMKKSWEDGNIVKNDNFSINRSKREKELLLIIKDLTDKNVHNKTIRNDEGEYFFPDIIIEDKIIIEYNGDYWHANPNKYEGEDLVHHNIQAKHIWEKDKVRLQKFRDLGYFVLVVWESDYMINDVKILKEIKDEIDKRCA